MSFVAWQSVDAIHRVAYKLPCIELHIAFENQVNGMCSAQAAGRSGNPILPIVTHAGDGHDVGTVLVVESQADASIALQSALQRVGIASGQPQQSVGKGCRA